MRRHIPLLPIVAFLAAEPVVQAPVQAAATSSEARLAIDSGRSEMRFTVTKLGFSDVTGVFRESAGEIAYDPAEPSRSSVHWRARVSSVLTDAANRDQALQGREYFDAARCPEISFASQHVSRRADGAFAVAGLITIRCQSHPLMAVVESKRLPDGRLAFDSEFEIDRFDFGVAGGLVMGKLIGRRVRISVRAVTRPVGQ
jgi:polyisoprenoid-binding protein YceI